MLCRFPHWRSAFLSWTSTLPEGPFGRTANGLCLQGKDAPAYRCPFQLVGPDAMEMLTLPALLVSVIADTDKQIFSSVLKAKPDLETEPWPRISRSAKDLIRSMLTVDCSRRITAADALSEWSPLCRSTRSAKVLVSLV